MTTTNDERLNPGDDENTQENAQDAPRTDESPQDGPGGAENPDDGSQGHESDRDRRPVHEAAKYRKRAQEAEAARDTLRGQLTGVRTSILEGIVGDDGAPVEAILAAGYTVDGFFGDGGRPDVEKIEAARVDVEKRFKITRSRTLHDRTPRAMLRGGSNPGEPFGNTWAAAFSPDR